MNIHQLLGCAIGLGVVKHQFPLKDNHFADQLSQLGDGDIFAITHVDMLVTTDRASGEAIQNQSLHLTHTHVRDRGLGLCRAPKPTTV